MLWTLRSSSLTRLVQSWILWKGLTAEVESFSMDCPTCALVQPQVSMQNREWYHVLTISYRIQPLTVYLSSVYQVQHSYTTTICCRFFFQTEPI